MMRRTWRLSPLDLFLLLLMVPATGVASEVPTFSDLSATNLPPGLGGSPDVELADLDGDGDLDVYLAGSGALLINSCGAQFSDETAARIGAPPVAEDALLRDVDGDGSPDLILARDGQNRLYLNTGEGLFLDATPTNAPPDATASKHAAAADVDGDGDLDLLFANGDLQADSLWINDGTGRFRDESVVRLPRIAEFTSALIPVDIDGDGDPDLFAATEACKADRLFVNDGTGRFTDETTSRLFLLDREGWSQGAGTGDFDGDGDLDLYVPQSSPNCHARDMLLTNDGGTFSDTSPFWLPDTVRFGSHTVTPADLDGDGDLDLVLPQPPRAIVLLNDGNGAFEDRTASVLPSTTGTTLSAAAGDMDLDGDIDLILSALDAPPTLLLNGGSSGSAGPPEVAGSQADRMRVGWNPRVGLHLYLQAPPAGAFRYNVYQGVMGQHGSHRPVTGMCHLELPQASGGDPSITIPTGGGSFYYLVTASSCAAEGTAGQGTAGQERPARSACGAY